MIELYQAEWCPYSHRVRQRLTELGLDFVARQVEVDPSRRERMQEAVGTTSIPTLVPEDGKPLSGVREILSYLDRSFTEPREAAWHRERDEDEGPRWKAA